MLPQETKHSPSESMSGWDAYWNRVDTWSSDKLFELNARIFYEGLRKEIAIGKNYRILNVGCGPGYLERILSPEIASMTGLDRSSVMIEKASRICRGLHNIEFFKHPSTEPDYGYLKQRTYHLFFCVSVAQYFRDYSQLPKMIRSLQKMKESGARLVLADLPQASGLFQTPSELADTFLQSVRMGYTAKLLTEILRHLPNYLIHQRQIYRSGQLAWSLEILSKLFINIPSIRWRVIQQPLSICARRLNVLIDL